MDRGNSISIRIRKHGERNNHEYLHEPHGGGHAARLFHPPAVGPLVSLFFFFVVVVVVAAVVGAPSDGRGGAAVLGEVGGARDEEGQGGDVVGGEAESAYLKDFLLRKVRKEKSASFSRHGPTNSWHLGSVAHCNRPRCG